MICLKERNRRKVLIIFTLTFVVLFLVQYTHLSGRYVRENQQESTGYVGKELLGTVTFKIKQHSTSPTTEEPHLLSYEEIAKMSGKNLTDIKCWNKPNISLAERYCTSYEQMRFLSPSESRQKVALASYPGSGNTWARLLLEELTGVYTGSMYTDGMLRCSGFLGEHFVDNTVLVVKTHRPEENPPYDKALFLFRNPFHSFLSYYQFILLKDHTKAYKEASLNITYKRFSMFMNHWTRLWDTYVFKPKMPYQLVEYESLKSNLEGELREILHFLNMTVDEKKLDCLLHYQNATTAYKRKNEVNKLPYNTLQISILRNWINQNAHILQKHGFDVHKWSWDFSKSIKVRTAIK